MQRSREEEGLDPLSIGKLRYRNRNYEGALSAFTETVRVSTGNFLLIALDHRAATYEKLDKLQLALKDSKQIIDLKPDGAKGYLRCCKILQMRGDMSLALKIYERGLSKVKVGTDEHRPLLEKLWKNLNAQQGPKKEYNPLVLLPTELAQMVCSYLKTTDLVACLRVHSSWKRYLEAQPHLWETLDTLNVKMNITELSLKAFLKRSNYTVHSALIRLIPTDFNVKKFKYLLRTCQRLKHLELKQGLIGMSLVESIPFSKSLQTLVLQSDTRITLQCVEKILAVGPHLKRVEFHNVDPGQWAGRSQWKPMPKLETIVLQASIKSSCEVAILNLPELIVATPNLRVAKIIQWRAAISRNLVIDFSQWRNVQELSLRCTDLQAMIGIPAGLQVLDVSNMAVLIRLICNSESNDIIYPTLTSLDFTGINTTALQFLSPILSASLKADTLRTLRCGELVLEDYDPAQFLPSQSLEELSLSGCMQSEDKILEILRKYPNLKRLDLSKTKVTGVAVKELMTRECGPLERLNLNDCVTVSPDAVEYARGKGTIVDRRFTSERDRYRDLNRW